MAQRGGYIPPEKQLFPSSFFNVTVQYTELFQQLHRLKIVGDISLYISVRR